MERDRWQQIENIFNSVLELSVAQREDYLASACASDAELRREVESLLANNSIAEAWAFLSRPAQVSPQGSPSSPLIGCALDEKYLIEKELGRGGMGAVYLATHVGTGRPVAVKVIAPQYMANAEFVERFKREARAAGLLRHPNVVNVTDFGFAQLDRDRVAYLVMEYLDGTTLAALLAERGRLPLELVIDIVEQIALAVAEAHKQGIVHRDLKPDNIWLQPDGRGGYIVKVLDFGLAKLYGERSVDDGREPSVIADNESALESPTQIQQKRTKGEDSTIAVKHATAGMLDARTVPKWLTRAGMVMGTPLYMSPEQCHGQPLDKQSDIYSLGIITYQMLTGEPPFTGDLYQLIDKHTNMPPPAMREKAPKLPQAVTDVVMRALAKSPAERPVSAVAFAAALRAMAEGDEPVLKRAGTLYRKHRALFLLISLRLFLRYLPLNVVLFYLFSTAIVGAEVGHSKFGLPLVWQAAYTVISALLFLYIGSIHTGSCAVAIDKIQKENGVRLKSVFAALRPRRRKLALTALRANLSLLSLRDWLAGALHAPVVTLGESHGRAALIESGALVEHIRPVITIAHLRNLLTVTGIVVIAQFSLIFYNLLYYGYWYTNTVESFWLHSLFAVLFALLPTALLLILHTRVAIANTLFYKRARTIAGKIAVVESNFTVMDKVSLAAQPIGLFRLAATVQILILLVTILLTGKHIFEKHILMMATINHHPDIIKNLTGAGVDVNTPDELGQTPLIVALKVDYSGEVVTTLLAAGADSNDRDAEGRTALMLAARYGAEAVALKLIAAGADVNARTRAGRMARLIYQYEEGPNIISGDINLFNELRITGEFERVKRRAGNTPLFYAIESGNMEIIKALLERGADVNARNNYGDTPLIWVLRQKRHYGIEKVLIAAGADLTAENIEGDNAMQVAEQEYPAMAESIKGYLAMQVAKRESPAMVDTLKASGGPEQEHIIRIQLASRYLVISGNFGSDSDSSYSSYTDDAGRRIIERGDTRIVIYQSQLSINSRSYGAIDYGDTVVIDFRRGKVLINFREVKP